MTFPDSLPHVTLLKDLNFVAVGLSFLGSLYIIYHCFTTKASLSASSKFILAIAITDFFYSVSNLMSGFQSTAENQRPEEVTSFCRWEAVIRFASFKLTLLYATCIAISCYRSSQIGKRFDQDQFFRKSLIAGAVVLTYLGILVGVFDDLVFANGQLVCSITVRKDANQLVWNQRQTLIYVLFELTPVFAMILITLLAYIGTVQRLKSFPKAELEALEISVYRLLWYPAIQFVTFLPGLINQFLFFLASSKNDSIFKFLFNLDQVFLLHSIGFINAINYGIQQIQLMKAREGKNYEIVSYNDDNKKSSRYGSYYERNNSVAQSLLNAQNDDF